MSMRTKAEQAEQWRWAAGRRLCADTGPWGAVCNQDLAHYYSCYDGSLDRSFNRHWIDDFDVPLTAHPFDCSCERCYRRALLPAPTRRALADLGQGCLETVRIIEPGYRTELGRCGLPAIALHWFPSNDWGQPYAVCAAHHRPPYAARQDRS